MIVNSKSTAESELSVNPYMPMSCGVAAQTAEWHNPRRMKPRTAFRQRRKALKWNQARLAEAAGVNTETVVRFESGGNVTSVTSARIEQAIADAERDLSSHTGTTQLRDSEVEDFDRDIGRGYKHHDVPVVGDAEASTNGFVSWDSEGVVSAQVEQWVSRSFGDGDPRAYALRVRGDSMVPRYFPGEIIIAQPRLAVRDGDFACVILTSGERLVKRVFRKDGTWLLKSLNEVYPERVVAHDEIAAIHRIKHSITT